MLIVFFGAGLNRFAKILNLHEKIRLTITTVSKPLESLDGQASDYVFHFILKDRLRLDRQLLEKL